MSEILQCNHRDGKWRRVRVKGGCTGGGVVADGEERRWEVADASNDSWVEVEEMRLHEREGIQVMRKVAGKLGNERFKRGEEEGMRSRHSS